MTKLFKPLLAAICAAVCVSRVSAEFCLDWGEIDCEFGGCDAELWGYKNGEKMPYNISYYFWLDGPSDHFYCARDNAYCYNPKRQRVRACGQEASTDKNMCAAIC